MRKKFQLYALLAGVNFETVLFFMAAWQIGDWLNDSYPKNFDWALVCYLLALILIARSWYVMFRIMIKDQKSNSGDDNEH